MSTTEQGDGVAAQAQEKAQQAAGQAKGQLRTQVDQRSTQAGEQVTQQASDIRTISQQLREQGKDRPAKLADQAADRAERLGSYLQDSDADRILHDVEDFARQRPWAVIAGGVALGFAASRFLKASSTDRYEASRYRLNSGRTYGQVPAAPSLPTDTAATGGMTSGPHSGGELSSGVTPGPRRAGAPINPSTHPSTPEVPLTSPPTRGL